MTTKVGNNIVDRRLLAAGVPKSSPHDSRATSTTILAGSSSSLSWEDLQ